MKMFDRGVLVGLGLLLLNLHSGAAQLCSDGTPGVDGNGVICCPIGCTQCGGEGCPSAGTDCCGSRIFDAGVYCDDSGAAPCIIGSNSPPATTCSDGTPGVDGNGVICCSQGCSQCGGAGCTTAGAEYDLDASDCCGTEIHESGVYCDISGEAPCIIGLTPPATTCSDGTPGVDGNGVVCCTLGCSTCAGPGCTTAGEDFGLGASDCCGTDIKEAGVYCDDSGAGPCIINPTLVCSDGTPGVDGNGRVCCTPGCTKCGGPGCTTAGDEAGLDADDCCGTQIMDSGVYCDDSGAAPCIIRQETPPPAPTPAPTMAPTTRGTLPPTSAPVV